PAGARDDDLVGVPHRRVLLDDSGRSPTAGARATVQLARAVRQLAPDVVHAQNAKATAQAGLAARAARPTARPPLLATFHGVLPAEYPAAARLLRLADHVASVSADLHDRIVDAGFPAARASVVRNAVEPAAPLSDEARAALDAQLGLEGAPVVAIVGRLVAQKAHHRFVRAAAIVARAVPAARFLIVGDGPLRDEIETSVREAGLAGRVVLTGVSAQARELIARADVLAFSSDWEGLSIAALEALAAGTPVVSTDVQGMRELLAGGAGAVVELDDGTALGERLALLLSDEAERAAMGRAGRELIEREFSLDGMLDAYERRYRALTGG
ncbi:MAG TPA: glycosyltransferase, partial [Capillimicrobium sp.]